MIKAKLTGTFLKVTDFYSTFVKIKYKLVSLNVKSTKNRQKSSLIWNFQ